MNLIRLSALAAVVCGLASTACVKFKSGCVGMNIQPRSYVARIGQSQVFTTQVQSTPTQDCTFAVSSISAADLVPLAATNQTKLVVKATLGGFLLRAASVDDPSRHCNVLVSVFNFNFGVKTPLALAGLETDHLLGDVAIGGSGSSTFIANLTSSDSKVYIATFRTDASMATQENTIRRFTLGALNAGNATPEYDLNPTIGAAGFFNTGFGVQNPPHIAADGQGVAYWLSDLANSGIGRLLPTLTQGQVPSVNTDIQSTENANVTLDFGTDIAADAQGRLYVIGQLIGGPMNTSLIRVDNLFNLGGPPAPSAVVLADGMGGSSWALAVDSEGRILMAVNPARSTSSIVRVLAAGGVDPGFTVVGTLLGPISELDVDANGVIYATENTGTSSVIQLLNDSGMIVDQIPHDPAHPSPSLNNVLGVGVSSDGSIAILDQVTATGAPPGQFFLVQPGPLH